MPRKPQPPILPYDSRLTVIGLSDKRAADREFIWICSCSCGNFTEVKTSNLKKNTKSCGCLVVENIAKIGRIQGKNNNKDISNERFGKLIALSPTEKRVHRSIVWKCRCDCGSVKDVPISSLTTGGVKSCGCLKRDPNLINHIKAKNYKGENHPRWKGGISGERSRWNREYGFLWREEVFKRDNYTCQCCGDKTGGNLEAHHVYNWAEHKNLREDVDNGITFCKQCHINFHRDHSYLKTTFVDLMIFLNKKEMKNASDKTMSS